MLSKGDFLPAPQGVARLTREELVEVLESQTPFAVGVFRDARSWVRSMEPTLAARRYKITDALVIFDMAQLLCLAIEAAFSDSGRSMDLRDVVNGAAGAGTLRALVQRWYYK
jgi:hypothetical protein